MWSSVRARLTLWYVSVFGLLLIAFSSLIYGLISTSMQGRTDLSLSNAAQTTAGEFLTETNEFNGDADTGARETLHELVLTNVHTAIFEETRLLISNYPEAVAPELPEEALKGTIQSGKSSFSTVPDGTGDQLRTVVRVVSLNGKTYFIMVAESLRDLTEQLQSIRRIFFGGFAASLALAGIGGFLLARKSLSPVVEMSTHARRISADNLQERLTVHNAKDELGQLARVLNELLDRFQQSFEGMRQFMADASHELRTPLSVIRGEADVALSHDRGSAEYREALSVIQDEARRLSHLVNDMFALARADAGQYPVRFTEINLDDVMADSCRKMQVLADGKLITLRSSPGSDISFRGDEDLIRRLLINLLDNAIKYTPSGGVVSVDLQCDDSDVRLSVSDTGIGIPAEVSGRVFERFFRVNGSRSRIDGGSGLGLAIAKWIAEVHRGSIEVVSQPDGGSSFVVRLPL